MNQAFAVNELVEIDGNPAPDGIRVSSFRTADGLTLRAGLTPSALSRSRGTVVLLQGRNETIEKYFETIGDLAQRGYGVATFDWRGQGGSQRILSRKPYGHVRNFANYVNDLECFIHDVVLPDCRPPYALLAHSMGGLVALSAAPRLSNSIERMVLCAPLVDFPERLIGLKGLRFLSAVGKLLGLARQPIRPAFFGTSLPRSQTSSTVLSSDPKRLARNRALQAAAPQLFLGSPTVGWLAGITKAMRQFDDSNRIAKLGIPTLIVGAGADNVVSTAACERLAWRMRSGSSVTIPGARHELLQEADRFREPVLEAFFAFTDSALTLPVD